MFIQGWFRVYSGLFRVIQGWFRVYVKSVDGWIKVHVGIQGVCVYKDRYRYRQIYRQIGRYYTLDTLDTLDTSDTSDTLVRLDQVRLDRQIDRQVKHGKAW